jgi:hypothetical protein
MTGISASTSFRMCGARSAPPSSLTPSTPASWMSRAAFRSVSSGLMWKVRYGMSATTSARGFARTTAAAWETIWSRVTGSVVS